MQKSEDAAMYMQKNFEDVKFLYPKVLDLDYFLKLSPSEPFSEESVEYLNALSLELNKSKKIKNYPDVATFSFFCRKGNILQLKKNHVRDQTIRLGRGIVFHIAPSNVPVNFAYSLVCGILSGNSNIVRVPTKEFEQVQIICEAIHNLGALQQCRNISERLALVRYERQSTATAYFSAICDVRIIWGGDETIEQIRKNSIPPRAFDVTFADRYSFCVINADAIIHETAINKITEAFYNDTYLFDQNACTAPHLIIWLGEKNNVEKSKKIFWSSLLDVVKSKYIIQPVIAIDKLTAFYTQAVQLKNVQKVNMPNNFLWRIKLKELPHDIDEYRCTSGYFSEFHASSLLELSKIINRKYQTLAYYGIEKNDLLNFIKQIKPFGIDRIVPIGRTTDFSLNWDGFDLITTLSRGIEMISKKE